MTRVAVPMTYVGRRLSTENRLCYAYSVEGEPKLTLWSKPLFPGLIGEKWTIEKDERGSVYPKSAINTKEPVDREKANAWEAEDIRCLQEDVQTKFNKKLAKRATEFEKALLPIRTMLASLKYHEDKAAFIQRVTAELWRRTE